MWTPLGVVVRNSSDIRPKGSSGPTAVAGPPSRKSAAGGGLLHSRFGLQVPHEAIREERWWPAGEVVWLDVERDGRRPVVVLTCDEALPRSRNVVVALVTRTIRGIDATTQSSGRAARVPDALMLDSRCDQLQLSGRPQDPLPREGSSPSPGMAERRQLGTCSPTSRSIALVLAPGPPPIRAIENDAEVLLAFRQLRLLRERDVRAHVASWTDRLARPRAAR